MERKYKIIGSNGLNQQYLRNILNKNGYIEAKPQDEKNIYFIWYENDGNKSIYTKCQNSLFL